MTYIKVTTENFSHDAFQNCCDNITGCATNDSHIMISLAATNDGWNISALREPPSTGMWHQASKAIRFASIPVTSRRERDAYRSM